MKVFIQIPCLNEEQTLPLVLSSIPTQIDGVDELEILVIDDGSTDRTVEVAKAHRGHAFRAPHTATWGSPARSATGSTTRSPHGADIVVNTDGDNQYPQARIATSSPPIMAGEADIVIGDRQTQTIAHFSPAQEAACSASAATS